MATRATALLLSVAVAAGAQGAPVVDYHQHMFSPAAAVLVFGQSSDSATGITARDLITLLDSAGIRRAIVLSMAYTWSNPARNVPDDDVKARAENDWTAEQVAKYPDRLMAFCSVNPLRDYALSEIARCAKNPMLRRGLKLHFGNSDVQLEVPAQLEKVKEVFRAANANRMAIAVHMHANINRHRPYGAEQARIFIEQLLAAAPDVPVQVAHLAGAGGADDPSQFEALAVFADAIAKKDPRMKNVWFDVAAVVDVNSTAAERALIARHVRALGVARVLYGTDAAFNQPLRARDLWSAFREIPLTEAEFRTIAANVAPYAR